MPRFARRFRPSLRPVLVGSLFFLVAACGGDDEAAGPTPVDFVEVEPVDLTIAVGEAATLTATPRDVGGNALEGREVKWSTTTPDIVDVDETGRVTGRSAGTGIVVATVDGIRGSAGVVVENPAPAVESIDPDSVVAGADGFELTVSGSGFVQGSTVRWEGSDRPTVFVSEGRLEATIRADDVREPGTFRVTVVSESPGGGVSEGVEFHVASCREGGVSVGQEAITDALDSGDCSTAAGHFFDLWSLATEETQLLEFDLASDAFDPVLVFEETDGTDLAADDDAGFGSDARLAVEVPLGAEAMLNVSSAAPGTTGSYTLEVRALTPLAVGDSARGSASGTAVDAYGYEASAGDGIFAFVTGRDGLDLTLTLSAIVPEPIVQDAGTLPGGEAAVAIPDSAGLRSIHVEAGGGTSGSFTLHLRRCRVVTSELGATLSGTLGASECAGPGDSPVVLVTFHGAAGDSITLDLGSEWDNRLALWGPDGALLGRDDDGGSGTDARLALTLSVDGLHVVEISATEPGTTGDFMLTIAQ